MSTFSDTFTKNAEQEELLNYDDQASFYFLATVLSCIVFPWTYRMVKGLFVSPEEEYHFRPKTPKDGYINRYCRNQPMGDVLQRVKNINAANAAKQRTWYTTDKRFSPCL